MVERIIKEIIPEYSEAQRQNSKPQFNWQWFLHLFWLLVATAAIGHFGIEANKGLRKATAVIFFGYMFYQFVPIQFKKLAMVAMAIILEVWMLKLKPGIGVALIIFAFTFLSYVRPKWLRTILVLALTAASILIVLNVVKLPVARIIIMYSALFLMWRYIFLLYELNYFKTPPLFIDRLCYLFLIPNACFPLFAIVDPKVYMSKFYEIPQMETFKKGMTWITRGILHTLMYRFIYLFLTPSPYEIDGFWDLVHFVLASYSLILRLSGLYYMSLGFLTLFGFNLPTIFDHYFFANGFPDLWRRINLYWRAFMQRVFYYPTLFKLKKWPLKWSVFLTTCLMFACTWFLHAWQWFWIKGKYNFTANDILFWSILGLLIAVNSVFVLEAYENEKEQKPRASYKKGAGVILMLLNMSFLWSLWTASSLTEWVYIMSFVKKATLMNVICFIGSIGIVMLIAIGLRYLWEKKHWFEFVFKDFNIRTGLPFLLIVVVGTMFGTRTEYKDEVRSYINNSLNTRDRSIMERGYYEQILNNDAQTVELFNMGKKAKWNVDHLAYQQVNSILMKEFQPNFTSYFKGDTLRTNNIGLRDKNYEMEKDPKTVRISAVGGSYEMGSGVGNEENFLALIEQELNSGKYSDKKIEVLNYGEGGYHLLQNVYVVKNKVKQMNPDFLFYFAHTSEKSRCLENFVNVIEKKLPLNFTFLDSIYQLSGITDKMCRLEKYNRLKPYIDLIITWGYNSISNYCKQNNIVPVLVYLPTNANLRVEEDREFCIKEGASAGFEVLDMNGVYKEQIPFNIQLSSWDAHPNQKGHRIIAERLLKELLNHKNSFKFLK
jgi:hypothetical protein